jgi:hypothetical protein
MSTAIGSSLRIEETSVLKKPKAGRGERSAFDAVGWDPTELTYLVVLPAGETTTVVVPPVFAVVFVSPQPMAAPRKAAMQAMLRIFFISNSPFETNWWE